MKIIMPFLCLFLLVLLAFSGLTLGEEGNTNLIENLIKDLKSPDYEKAWEAARRLSEFPQHKTDIVPALIEALKYEWNHCSGDIRNTIAYTLSELNAKEAVFPLLELLRSGKTTEHECAECGCCFLVLTPRDEIISRTFNPFCRSSILSTINQLADFSYSKTMADLISEGHWKPELIITIGKVGLPRYAYFISRFKDDKDVDVRRAVAVALGLIENDDITIPILIQLLCRDEEDFLVKWEASNSLIKILKKNQNCAKRLMELLGERDKISVLLVARTLAMFREEEGLMKLREMATDEDSEVRSEAVLYMGDVSDTASKDILIRRLKDESLRVRACAIFALGRISDPSIIPILKKAFENSNDYSKGLEKKKRSGVSEKMLRERCGFGVFDLRETLQEAINTLQKRCNQK